MATVRIKLEELRVDSTPYKMCSPTFTGGDAPIFVEVFLSDKEVISKSPLVLTPKGLSMLYEALDKIGLNYIENK